jgi:hypothetical protein
VPSFYFEQVLQSGLNGVDQQGITGAILQLAGVLLVFTALWSAYEAYCNGGSVRQLALTAVKYLVLGFIFINYQNAFRMINFAFNGVADGLYSLSGGADVIQAWQNSLSQAWNTDPNWFSSLWNWATGGISAIVAGLITLIGYVLLPFTYTLFTLLYVVYGAILYVVGPLVLALMPVRGLGNLGRSFCANMIIFQCWGLLYAILQALMSALQMSNPLQISGSFLQAFVGASQVIVVSLVSVMLSVMIAMIPLLASRIVRGDIGSNMLLAVNGVLTAISMLSGLTILGTSGVARGQLPTEGFPPFPSSPGFFRASDGLATRSLKSPGVAGETKSANPSGP